MATKRTRVDGQISRDEYMLDEGGLSSTASTLPGVFSKATPNTLANRKVVVAAKFGKKELFSKHIHALNSSFFTWFKSQVQENDLSVLTAGAQDYVDYVTQLQDRYLRSYGEVLTFGSGDCGQLAHGVENDDDLMVRFPRIVYSLRDKKVCSVACGGLHNAAVTETGHVFTWGCNDDGSLGREGDESLPFVVKDLSGVCVVNVACGDGQTIAVTSTGEVYGWGCYKDKEGKKWFTAVENSDSIRRSQDTPMLIGGISGAIDVACGSVFNIARCDDGSIYSWGLGECGELARQVPPMKQGEEYNETAIRKHHLSPGSMYTSMVTASGAVVQDSVPVRDAKAIGCGAYHSLVVLVNPLSMDENACALFSTGLNNYGQLGLGDTTNRVFLTHVLGTDHVHLTEVKGGVHHSLALSSAGDVYAWGRGDSGQLGITKASLSAAGDFLANPEKVVIGNNEVVSSISCGGNHNLALTTSNAVYTWGYGDMFALGHGKESDESVPKTLNFSSVGSDGIGSIQVTQISGGGQHSAVIGKVISAAR